MQARILIADDNPAVRTALRQLLMGSDREITEAEDGADAVSKALETRPDIAILDLAMPAMDGLSAAREISRHLPHAALVMCTMHGSSQLLIEAQKCGIRKVINKSEASLLVSTVAELIATRPSPDPAQLPPNTLPAAPIIEAIVPSADDLGTAIEAPEDTPPSKSS